MRMAVGFVDFVEGSHDRVQALRFLAGQGTVSSCVVVDAEAHGADF